MLKVLGLLLILVGIMMIYLKLSEIENKKRQKIEYRFIPRTFVMEQNNLPLPTDVFNKMFQDPSVWMGYTDLDSKYKKKLNKINRMEKETIKLIEERIKKQDKRRFTKYKEIENRNK